MSRLSALDVIEFIAINTEERNTNVLPRGVKSTSTFIDSFLSSPKPSARFTTRKWMIIASRVINSNAGIVVLITSDTKVEGWNFLSDRRLKTSILFTPSSKNSFL